MADLREANALLTVAQPAAWAATSRVRSPRKAYGWRSPAAKRRRWKSSAANFDTAGAWAEAVLADLADVGQAAGLIERAEATVGPLDLLVNNAGIEVAAAYPAFTDEELAAITRADSRLRSAAKLIHSCEGLASERDADELEKRENRSDRDCRPDEQGLERGAGADPEGTGR